MTKTYTTTAISIQRRAAWLTTVALILTAGGCASNDREVQMDNPALAAYVKLIMPIGIEIKPHWTKPVSFSETGAADGLEVFLAAYDSFGDNTKLVGTLHIELHTRRMASSDRLDRRIAFWPIELNSKESLTRHWDPLARFYRFRLKLTDTPLVPGRYILSARLLAPNEQRLFDEYEFTRESGPVPPAEAQP